jgi:hypothetical protein
MQNEKQVTIKTGLLSFAGFFVFSALDARLTLLRH